MIYLLTREIFCELMLFLVYVDWPRVLKTIRRMIDKKTVDVFNMFTEELNFIKKEMTQKTLLLSPFHPKYSGLANQMKMLKKGIERSMAVRLQSTFLQTWLTNLHTA